MISNNVICNFIRMDGIRHLFRSIYHLRGHRHGSFAVSTLLCWSGLTTFQFGASRPSTQHSSFPRLQIVQRSFSLRVVWNHFWKRFRKTRGPNNLCTLYRCGNDWCCVEASLNCSNTAMWRYKVAVKMPPKLQTLMIYHPPAPPPLISVETWIVDLSHFC